jgi:hypothetical protein
MSAAPGAPAEAPEADVVTSQALEERLELFGHGLKSRLEIVDRKTVEQIADRAISDLRATLERERQNRESAESSKRLDRSLEWSKRFTCAVAGGVICLVLFISLQECSSLHSRVTTLELKK